MSFPFPTFPAPNAALDADASYVQRIRAYRALTATLADGSVVRPSLATCVAAARSFGTVLGDFPLAVSA